MSVKSGEWIVDILCVVLPRGEHHARPYGQLKAHHLYVRPLFLLQPCTPSL